MIGPLAALEIIGGGMTVVVDLWDGLPGHHGSSKTIPHHDSGVALPAVHDLLTAAVAVEVPDRNRIAMSKIPLARTRRIIYLRELLAVRVAHLDSLAPVVMKELRHAIIIDVDRCQGREVIQRRLPIDGKLAGDLEGDGAGRSSSLRTSEIFNLPGPVRVHGVAHGVERGLLSSIYVRNRAGENRQCA